MDMNLFEIIKILDNLLGKQKLEEHFFYINTHIHIHIFYSYYIEIQHDNFTLELWKKLFWTLLMHRERIRINKN